jgi:ABC-type phosphate/phosphonate transport system ATPase subunit
MNFVALRRLDIVDDQVITAMNFRIIHVWQAIAPYVFRERELMAARGMQLLEILESYATAAEEMSSGSMRRLLGY